MSKDLVRVASKALENPSTKEKVGMEMIKAGGLGIGLWFLAGVLPFITLPMIFVAMVVGGFFL